MSTKDGKSKSRTKSQGAPRPYRFLFTTSHHRLVLGSMAAVIIGAWVFGATFRSCSRTTGLPGSEVGVLFEEPVTALEFETAQRNAMLQTYLTFGFQPEIQEELGRNLPLMAWRRLALLKTADKYGFMTGNREVSNAIKREFTDPESGFNKRMYDQFVVRAMRTMGIRSNEEASFVAYYREQMNVNKLRDLVASATWVTPRELVSEIEVYTDMFTIEHAVFPFEDLAGDVEVSDDDIKAFFEDDPESFMVPEKLRVRYVTFPLSDYEADIEITEDELNEFYTEFIEEFTFVATNSTDEAEEESAEPELADETVPVDDAGDAAEALADAEEPVAEPADPDDTIPLEEGLSEDDGAEEDDSIFEDMFAGDSLFDDEVKYHPFEDVKDDIRDRLVRERATDAARSNAMMFVEALLPDRNDHSRSFEEVATEYDRSVSLTDYFARDEDVAEAPDFGYLAAEAFQLDTEDPTEYFSNPLPGTQNVYVIAVDSRIDEHLPELTDVIDDVKATLVEKKTREAAESRAEDITMGLRAEMRTGKAFSEAIEPFGVTVETTPDFSLFTPLANDVFTEDFLRAIITRDVGELTEPVALSNGLAIATVVERTPGSSAYDPRMRQRLSETIRRQQAGLRYMDWQDRLFESANIEELLAKQMGQGQDAGEGVSEEGDEQELQDEEAVGEDLAEGDDRSAREDIDL